MKPALHTFAGVWKVESATLPNGDPAYTGSIQIAEKGSSFDLDWNISAGHYVGIGIAVGSHLYVSCGEQRAGLGLAVFEVGAEGVVSIRWSTPELQGRVGSGAFTTSFNGHFQGEHDVTHFHPDGAAHDAWTINIRKRDSVFEIHWRKGDTIHLQGLGLATPGGLIAGWYPDLQQLAVLDYLTNPKNPDRLSATWALGGFSSLGTETLTRL